MSESWDEIGDGIFRRRHRSLALNVGVIIGERGCVVIDTRIHEAQADELRAAIRSLTDTPIRWVVNTHWHWDHTFGNARFTDAPIVSHRAARDRLERDGEEAKRSSGAWLGDEDRLGVEAVQITLPDVVFDDRMELDLGDRRITLEYLGRGHTDNDIVIRADDVLFAGDLIEESAPPIFYDGWPLDWAATLDRVTDTPFRVAVPGHGDLMPPDVVATQRGLIADVVALAGRIHEAGGTAEDVTDADHPWPRQAAMAAVDRALWQLRSP
ncbi:MAG: MBL fold metallo-hydrolase [Acidimicrobiia bacterium]|nr:MBL fold metallo-hydrolase [Acidimicrobiia bacterium]